MPDSFSLDPEPVGLADVAGFRVGTSAPPASPARRTGPAPLRLEAGGVKVGVLLCENPDGAGTAVLSRNAVRSAPVTEGSPGAIAGRLQALVVNSGGANCFTGEVGLRDARAMASVASSRLSVDQGRVLVASYGALARPIPMEEVRTALQDACAAAVGDGSAGFSDALAGRQTPCRAASASGTIDGKPFRVAGVARIADATEPDETGSLAFLVTDAAVAPDCLREILIAAADPTFDRLVLDGGALRGGAGTNDVLCLLASARAGNELIDNVFSVGPLTEAVEAVARRLIAMDVPDALLPPGRGVAAGIIEVRVAGATNGREAELASRAIASSLLVKTALQADEAPWAYVLAAAGGSGARVESARATVRLAGETVCERGEPVDRQRAPGGEREARSPLMIELDLGVGNGEATVWTHHLPVGGKEAVERLEKATKEAEAAAAAECAALEAKLAEAELAREAAVRGSAASAERLQEAERAERETKATTEEAVEKAAATAAAEGKVLAARLEQAELEADSAVRESKALCERLQAAERAAREARAAAEDAVERATALAAAGRAALEAKLAGTRSALDKALRESEDMRRRLDVTERAGREVTAAAEREELEAKLGEAESAREAAVRESGALAGRIEAAGLAVREAKAASEKAMKAALSRAAAEREALEAKLGEAESAREAAVRESGSLARRLEVTERAMGDARATTKNAVEAAHARAAAERVMLRARLRKAEAAREVLSAEAEKLKAGPGPVHRR